jgi:hypothetical protein
MFVCFLSVVYVNAIYPFKCLLTLLIKHDDLKADGRVVAARCYGRSTASEGDLGTVWIGEPCLHIVRTRRTLALVHAPVNSPQIVTDLFSSLL